MAGDSLTGWQTLKLKMTLWAVPSYVIPRALLQYCYCKVSNIRCPSQVDLIRNKIIQWLSSTLDHEQFRVAVSPPQSGLSLSPQYTTLLNQKATVSKANDNSFQAYWMPFIPDSEYTIFYIHGGGFASGSTAANSSYLLQMATELCNRGLKCSILSVDYDLSPEAQYPTALRQVASAYAYTVLHGKPIILIGDSAGGHLCLSLLRHIDTPHPKIESSVSLEVPKLMVLVSPWVDLKNVGASVRENAKFDCLDEATLNRWSRQYLGSLDNLDIYTDHLCPKTQWKDILPNHSLIMAGEFECFVSDIKDLSDAIQDDGYEDLKLLVEPFKCHAWPAVDFSFGIPDTKEIGEHENPDTSKAMFGLRSQVRWILSHGGK